MKNYPYVGLFRNKDGHEYELTVFCNGAFMAYILLMAEAYKAAKHIQLYSITDEFGEVYLINDNKTIFNNIVKE